MSSRRPARLTARRLLAALAALSLALAAALAAAISLGAGEVSPWRLIAGDADAVARTILLQVRLPRVLLAALLGGALSVAGIVFQALLRNPLADPYVLGVSGGASIGGVLAVLAGFAGAGPAGLGVAVCAFLGALAALVLIRAVATVDGRLTVYTVLLTGAIFNAFAAALIYFVQSIASLEQLHSIVFYLMGRIPSLDAAALAALAAPIVAVTIGLWVLAREFNALSLGETGAAHVGVDVERLKQIALVLGSLLTGLSVAVAGLIGFVGLVVPHLLRLVLGPDHRVLLPAGFLAGAAFLVLADLLARTLTAPTELPVGVVTALVGGPFFLVVLRARGDRGF